MSNNSSYIVSDAGYTAQAELERLAAQVLDGWDKESRLLSSFGLTDGMAVFEPGCGPGFVTNQLLKMLPCSLITCLDSKPSLLEQAKQFLGSSDQNRVRFVAGSVTDAQLEQNHFDIAYARFLFQHVADPIAAATEIYRVLKPGGKLIVHDIDDSIFGLFSPEFPEFTPILKAFGNAQASRGGNRSIGGDLTGILTRVGFTVTDFEVVSAHSGERALESFLTHISPDRMQSLVNNGFLLQTDLDLFRVALNEWAASPDAFTLWLSLMICAEKPVNTD